MHELSLATDIIDLIRPGIPEGETLRSVQVSVGLLAGVCGDSLQFCFSELARLAGYPEARLKMIRKPARYRCLSCDCEYEVHRVENGCSTCGSMMRILLSGTELSVDYIEI